MSVGLISFIFALEITEDQQAIFTLGTYNEKRKEVRSGCFDYLSEQKPHTAAVLLGFVEEAERVVVSDTSVSQIIVDHVRAVHSAMDLDKLNKYKREVRRLKVRHER